MLLSIITFVVVLGILVFVHELGHFLVAKWTGMRVDEFAIGFPPRLFGLKRGETTYAINMLPLGGYVKIYGENGQEAEDEPRAFNRKSVWARAAVLVAGVSMNLIFAFVVLCIAYSVGFPAISSKLETIPGAQVTGGKVYVAGTQKDSPAARAGLKEGDVVISFIDTITNQNYKVETVTDLQKITKARQLEGHLSLSADVERDGKTVNLPVIIATSGTPLGVEVVGSTSVKMPLYRTPQAAVEVIRVIASSTWEALKGFAANLFHAKLDPNVSGPVGIYKATASAAQDGLASVVFLTVALSINLALLNILPLPVLDGGKLLFVVIEAVFRKRVIAVEIENLITAVGFFLLIGLILLITLKDIGLV